MSGRQRPQDKRDRQSQGGLKTIFGLFRTVNPNQKDLVDSKRRTFFPRQDISSSPTVGSGGQSQTESQTRQTESQIRSPRRHQRDNGASRKLAPNRGSSAGKTNDSDNSPSNFFTKLLRRKQSSNRPRNRDTDDLGPGREQTLRAQTENETQTPRSRRDTRCSVVPELDQRGVSRIDAKINAQVDKRRSQIYVPTHAAADFEKLPVSRSLKDRYSTLMNEEEAKRLSQMLAQLSPPIDVDDSRPQSYVSDDMFRDEQRRRATATLEGVSNIDTDSSFGLDTGLNNTLQPPPIPSRRQHQRRSHSYALASDPRQISEEVEVVVEMEADEPIFYQKGSSDYQNFVQQALARDQRDSGQMWQNIMSRSDKRRSVTPVHQDFTNIQHPADAHPLERSNTFGGSRKGRHGSKNEKIDAALKRASNYSMQSRDERQRRSYIGGDSQTEAPPREARKRSSASKRLSDYIRPPREINNRYEQPENKRSSRATFR